MKDAILRNHGGRGGGLNMKMSDHLIFIMEMPITGKTVIVLRRDPWLENKFCTLIMQTDNLKSLLEQC